MTLQSKLDGSEARPRTGFISYAHVEEGWRDRILEALEPLEQEGIVETWHDGKLLPGDRWHDEILSNLADADLVLLLVSKAFLASEYVQSTEAPRAVGRASRGRSRLVPVILESCDWVDQPFAQFQALPSDRVPLAERSDVDEALKDCLLRLRQVVFDGQTASLAKSPRSLPLLRLVFATSGPALLDWSALIGGVRRITGVGGRLRTNKANRIGPEPNELTWEWLLEGPNDAFTAIEASHNEGRLAGELGVQVSTVERTLGATFFAGTDLVNEDQGPPALDRTVSLGGEVTPPLFFGIAVRPSEPEWFLPFYTKNGHPIADEVWQREKQKLFDYFETVLALPGEDVHVNLSNLEADRMMPANLAQTNLGRLLAEQDCLLKQVTASMLHPKNPVGIEYWDRLQVLADKFCVGKVDIWQKVWIVAGSATLNEKPAGETYNHPLPPGFEIRADDWLAHLSECSLRVMCDTDYLALSSRSADSDLEFEPESPFYQEALTIFRETVLPELEVEVNEGSHFAPLRQAYWTVALAKWYRERLAEPGIHTHLIERALVMRQSLGSSREIGPGPGAPEWMNECFAWYLELLDGVFRESQLETGPSGTKWLRIRHSGCVSLFSGELQFGTQRAHPKKA